MYECITHFTVAIGCQQVGKKVSKNERGTRIEKGVAAKRKREQKGDKK